MAKPDREKRGERAGRPSPIGVYSESGLAYFVLSQKDDLMLGDRSKMAVMRGRGSLGIAIPGEKVPLFVVDLEAELDLRMTRRVGVVVIDPGVNRLTRKSIEPIWP